MTEETRDSTISVPPSRPRRWVTLVLCTIIFVAGGVLGSGLTVLLRLEEWPRPKKTFEERRDQLTERIAEKLQLDTKQTDALRNIVGQRLQNLETIREKILPEMQIEAETLDRELRPLLNEEQIPRWEELYATLYEKWFRTPLTPTTETQPATQPK